MAHIREETAAAAHVVIDAPHFVAVVVDRVRRAHEVLIVAVGTVGSEVREVGLAMPFNSLEGSDCRQCGPVTVERSGWR